MPDRHSLDSEVDPRELRTALGHFATGVVVLTTSTGAGPIGMTMNSFCSVSLTPPLVLFCVQHSSQLCAPFTAARSWAVNVLHEDQRGLADQFARRGYDRFRAVGWRPGTTGSPVLAAALSVLECITERTATVGDHDVVFGRVVDLHPVGVGGPLVFWGGAYHRAAPHLVDSEDRDG